jgi:hypothetical protein
MVQAVDVSHGFKCTLMESACLLLLHPLQDKLAFEKRTAKQLKTEDGPKPAPVLDAGGSSSAAVAATEPAAAGDVDMKDADAAGPSSAVVAGAQTGVWCALAAVDWTCVVSHNTAYVCHA